MTFAGRVRSFAALPSSFSWDVLHAEKWIAEPKIETSSGIWLRAALGSAPRYGGWPLLKGHFRHVKLSHEG